MKNKVAFAYMLIVIFLFFAFSFSFYIQIKQDNSLRATQTQSVQATLDRGIKEFHIQLTALAESTPYP